MDKASYLNFTVEIIHRSDGQEGFQILRAAGSWSGHLAG